MSNFLAVAAVTASLGARLAVTLPRDVAGTTVTTGRPERTEGAEPAANVNIFLYQVTPNAAWRNADLPTRRQDGGLARRPLAALDLHYLFSFRGDEAELVPQRLLGSVVRTLHAYPVLTRQRVRDTIAAQAFLTGCTLADDVELVKFTPQALSLEDLSRLWSTFFQTPYALSVAYQATVVLIESEEMPAAALPVRERGIFDTPIQQPHVESAGNALGAGRPLVSGSTLLIRGQRLRGLHTRVIVAGRTLRPADADVSDQRITLVLPPEVPAGLHGVQVAHLIELGVPPTLRRGVESVAVPLLLHPTVERVNGDFDIALGAPRDDGGQTFVDLTVRLAPPVGRTQRAVLLLNELGAPADRAARAYVFDAQLRNDPNAPETSDTLVFPTTGVVPGSYLVRVQVDGAATPVEIDEDDQSPTYGQIVRPRAVFP